MSKRFSAELILASSSPRRRALLKTLNLPFKVMISDVSEELYTNLRPFEMVQDLAQLKARAISKKLEAGFVIGSDTTIAFEGVSLGKPLDEEDAKRTLLMLRNIPHQVISGIAIIDVITQHIEVGVVSTNVKMRNYTDQQINDYIASGEPMDKAGSYAIQGLGSSLIETIEGCYNNVVGLPLCELAVILQKFGIIPKIQGPVCKLPSGNPCPRLLK